MNFTEEAIANLENYMPITESGCHVYLGTVKNSGYANIKIEGKTYRLHRVSYEFYKGIIPENLLVRHTCDIKCCINPAHLILGTNKDNSKDMVRRGRSAKGSKHGGAKLTEKQILEIRMGHFKDTYYARKFGVNRSIINAIKHNKTWKHI